MVGTGIGRARCEQISTGGSAVRWLTETGETGDSIHAGALIQTWAGRTFIDVHLTQVTSKSLPTLAAETIELVNTGACILAQAGRTVISV